MKLVLIFFLFANGNNSMTVEGVFDNVKDCSKAGKELYYARKQPDNNAVYLCDPRDTDRA